VGSGNGWDWFQHGRRGRETTLSAFVLLGVGRLMLLPAVGNDNFVCRLPSNSLYFAGVIFVCLVFSPERGTSNCQWLPLGYGIFQTYLSWLVSRYCSMLKGEAADVISGKGVWVLRRTSMVRVNICVLVCDCLELSSWMMAPVWVKSTSQPLLHRSVTDMS
jgi:hypothetical protein